MTTAPAKILIVDDEPPICTILSRWLAKEGHLCQVAHNGREALEKLRAEPFDLMLTDINMPVMTGTELLAEARKEFRDLAVIMVTAVDDRTVALAALELGAFGYLLKPFERIEVLIHVDNAIRLRRLEIDKKEHHRELVELFLERTRAMKQAYSKLERQTLQLMDQDKLATLGQLTAGVAHELRNPTTFLSSNINQMDKYFGNLVSYLTAQEKVLHELDPDGPMAEELGQERKTLKVDFITRDAATLIDDCREAIDRIRHIIEGIRDFSRKIDDGMREVDLNGQIESTLRIVWNELKYKTTVQRDFGTLPEVFCHPQKMNQVFTNLLVNAAQSIDKEGEVTITTRQENDQAMIQITDTGCGIPAGHLEKIFEPYFTTKEAGSGTGLGLAIVKQIIDEHEGTITVDSTPGQGTTFTIRIPLKKTPS